MEPMKRAINLARRALGSTSPNPPVGAVVVRGGRILGEGWTQPPGGPHAELVALNRAGPHAENATLYSTLEPCCHQGRTPPCTQAITRAGIAHVHIATLDPNPLVSGRGRQELENWGIGVTLGDQEIPSKRLIESYSKWISTGMPFVTAKFAMSLDGKIATESGESQWITGDLARAYGRKFRRNADSVMIGVETALQDDPRLTARDHSDNPLPRQPFRIIVDSTGRVPETLQIFRGPGNAFVAAAHLTPHQERQLIAAGAKIILCPATDGRVDLVTLFKRLGQMEITSVLVEGGGTLLSSLFKDGLVDKVVAFIAPMIIGGEHAPTPVRGRGVLHLRDRISLNQISTKRLGPDVLITGYLQGGFA